MQVLTEELGITELTDEQLDAVSGGVWRPSTKEEADETIGTIRDMVDMYGADITYGFLKVNGYPVITPFGLSSGAGIDELQRWWYHFVGVTKGNYYGHANYFESDV